MIRTRVAPSPTGEDLHIGNLYTAFINYTWAKKNGGRFIVRIEDTDRTRCVAGAEQRILDTLRSFGLSPDESVDVGGPYGPYRQSDRLKIYRDYAHALVENGHAYYCTFAAAELERMREEKRAQGRPPVINDLLRSQKHERKDLVDGSYVVRLRIPDNEKIVVHDLLRGELVFDSNGIDDQVLLKSDGYPTYHLAVVVDDHLMEISHVIRAEEWLTSLPKHVILYKAFGWDLPVFCHVPILRNPDRSKLSKRKNPVWASWFLEQGYLPDAVLNYLALQGWSHPQQKDIFDREEFECVFELKDLKTVGPAFDIQKLDWMNGEYIRKFEVRNLKLEIEHYLKKYHPGYWKETEKYPDRFEKSIPLIQERIKRLVDYVPLCESFFIAPREYEIDLGPVREAVSASLKRLQSHHDWRATHIGEVMQHTAKSLGMKNSEYFMAMRVAVTGKKISPPLNETMEILGKQEVLSRLAYAIQKIS
jgi:glutamyl-tRNA synthetase